MGPWSHATTLEEVLAVPRRMFAPCPGLRVVRRPGWEQLVYAGNRDGVYNEVMLAVLEPDDADAIIDATIAEYRRHGLRFRWYVPPGSAPDDLADRLAARGLTRRDLRGMSRRLSESPVDDHAAVEEVSAATLGDFSDVMAAGWSMERGAVEAINRVLLEDPRRRFRLYIARHEGAAAAVAVAGLDERSAYLMGGVVLPAYRGRGLYRALVSARLRDAARLGLALAISHAFEETSAPLLERMGFETVCRFPVFVGA